MTAIDRLRVASAVLRYDFWLDYRGVPRRQRRDLRGELRANLTDAARAEGVRAALLGIGSPKALAYATTEAHPTRARWSFAGYLAIATFVVTHLGWLLSVVGFVNGVRASDATGRTVGGELSFWGSQVEVALPPSGGGLTVSAAVPLSLWVLTLVVFLSAAQPWRPLAHRHTDRPAHP